MDQAIGYDFSRTILVRATPEVAFAAIGNVRGWQVLEGALNYVSDKTEWAGTGISFDIAPNGEMTEVRFTHIGLVPAGECYDSCSSAWGGLIGSSLKGLIETGTADASPF